MTETQHYDAIIIGTGQAGKPLASALAEAGHKTAIIEREHVGGGCVNVGCTPTKTMVASARTAYVARRASDYGVENGSTDVDMETVRQRKRDIVELFRSGVEKSLEETDGVDLIMGEASFVEPKTIQVNLEDGGDLKLTTDRIFINTGARPSMPPVEGLDEVPTLNSTTIMELDEVPEHLLILGGGYIGLEFGQMFRRFGSDVTIVQRRDQLLPREDEDVAQELADILREDGIEVFLSTEAQSATQTEDGSIQLNVETPDGEQTLEGSHLLVAAGRAPNTDSLDLEAAGIEVDERGFVPVNDKLETDVEGVWALGDVKGGPAFTHVAHDDFRIVEANLLGDGDESVEGRILSYTVYTDPQLGRVGLSAKDAREAGYEVKVAKMPMKYVARAMELDETRGFMKVVIEKNSDRILGCAILGIEGGELMSMIHIAMLGDMPFTTLRDAPFAHPTLAESFNNLFASL